MHTPMHACIHPVCLKIGTTCGRCPGGLGVINGIDLHFQKLPIDTLKILLLGLQLISHPEFDTI